MAQTPDEVQLNTEAASFADRLYAIDPSQFVAERTTIVRALKAEGRRELAGAVQKLRRPSVAAATLNHVLRSAPDDVAALLEHARALANGQRTALDGTPVDLAELRAGHRRAVDALAEQATRDHEVIAAAIGAASLDPAAHEALVAARYCELPTPTQGFDLLSGAWGDAPPTVRPPTGRPAPVVSVVPDLPAPAPEQPPAPEQAPASEQAVPVDTATERAEGARRSGVVGAIELADRRLAAAERAVSSAQDRVDALELRLSEAIGHLADTRRRRADAQAARARLDDDRTR